MATATAHKKTTVKPISEVLYGSRKFEFLLGDCLSVLKKMPNESVECVITSPPYWGLREYEIQKGYKGVIIGEESDSKNYIENLVEIFSEVKRVLKNDGSLWLNLGDKFDTKNLMLMPARVAIALQDSGWVLRSDIIWNQMKGTQSAKDRMRDVYEHIFHFVKTKKYYFDAGAVKIKPEKSASIVNGNITSATGVSGRRYREHIQNSTALTPIEKVSAMNALEDVLSKMRRGEIVDFRMTIRGTQRTYHSESTKISGRAKELETKGYFFLMMSADGFMPCDIWNIVPEDKWRKDAHCAVFPEELLQTPIKATSRVGGVVLDPFSGTGSAVCAALKLGRRGIGIDLSKTYLKVSEERIKAAFNGTYKSLF